MISKEESIEFEDEKTLYHYTSIQTAIEFIFTSKQLRLNPLTSAIDPMENNVDFPSISTYGNQEDHERLESKFDSTKIAQEVNKYSMSLRHLCLCRNKKKDYQGTNMGVFEPIDYFGFAKPRMWDQYGDKYRGICIALSREKLEKQLSSDYKIINIEYQNNNLFKPNIDTSTIDLNELERLGLQDYLRLKKSQLIKKISTKHTDYRDENECKIVYSSKDNYNFIDIQDCIQGIFFTDKMPFVYKDMLKNIASDFKIPLIKLSITRNGMRLNMISK